MFFGCRGKLAALLMLLVAGMLAGACDFNRTTTTSPGAMGQEVRDGTFGFTVTQVASSPTFVDKPAQGVYAIVSLTVKNVGTEPKLFDWSAQVLKDSIGREYSASFMVPSLFGDVVNAIDPGLDMRIKLAFDVPPGTKPTQIVLHDSRSSQGATVNLTQPPSSSAPRG